MKKLMDKFDTNKLYKAERFNNRSVSLKKCFPENGYYRERAQEYGGETYWYGEVTELLWRGHWTDMERSLNWYGEEIKSPKTERSAIKTEKTKEMVASVKKVKQDEDMR